MSACDDDILKDTIALVIEDDAMQLMAMQMLLESWGCVVLPAASADGAIQAIARGGRPNLIISDFRLPNNVSGMEAVVMARRAVGRDLPAILQTGDTDPALMREALALGYVMLHKPYDPNNLRRLMVTLREKA